MSQDIKYVTSPTALPPHYFGHRHFWVREVPKEGEDWIPGWRAVHGRELKNVDFIPDGVDYTVQHRHAYKIVKGLGGEVQYHILPYNAHIAFTAPEELARKQTFDSAKELWNAIMDNPGKVEWVVLSMDMILPFLADPRARTEFHYSADPEAQHVSDYGWIMGTIQVWMEVPHRLGNTRYGEQKGYIFWEV